MANPRDVELIVRARTEGEKALTALVGGLQDLAGTQNNLVRSGDKVDGVLARLGGEFAKLSSEVQGLAQLSKVVENLDRSAAALTRMEDRIAKTADELGRLQAAQTAAAAATAKAKAEAEAAAKAYSDQQAQAAAVRKEAGKTSETYQQQAAAVAAAKAARDGANSAVRAAESEERKLGTAILSVSSDLKLQTEALAQSHQEWEALYAASRQASAAMGGVAASQQEVAAAAASAAEKLALTKGAMDFERDAAQARKLRDAADYVRFWTAALNDKEAAEQRAKADQSAALFAEARQDAEQAARAMEAYQARLNASLGVQEKFSKSAEESFAVFAAAGRAEDQMASAAQRLKAQVDPLGAIQANLNRELALARDLYRAGYISANELAAAEKELAVSADRAAQAIGRSNSRGGKGTFLGLRPYELHSLSFQINDVFTQLASGTPAMQVLAQQGGQLFQVFQRQLLPAIARFGPAIAAALPYLAVVAAAVAAIVGAIKNLADEAASVKIFDAQMRASADGAAYNAKAMAEAAHQLDVYGGKLADARAALALFAKAGIRPEFLEAFGRAAQNVATITKTEVATAAKEMASAFSGGYNAVVDLDQKLNFLTATERQQIKALFDSGRAAEARTLAFDIFNKKMDAGAKAMRGPWAEALRNIAGAWDNFLKFLGNLQPIQDAIKLFAALAKVLRDVTALLPGADQGDAVGKTPREVAIERELTQLREQRARAVEQEAAAQGLLERAKKANPGSADALQKRYDEARARLESSGASTVKSIDKRIGDLTKELETLRANTKDTVNEADQARQKARDAAAAETQAELDRLGDLTDADKVRLAGEEAYRKSIEETGDAVIAQGKKELAMRAELDRQRKAINYGNLAGKIAGIESSGNANARNPNSTATGLGQFIEDTWVSLFKKHFPAEAANKTRQQILDLRRDSELSRKMIELYARDNAEILQKAGVSVDEAALYLAHFLGPQGAIKILKAAPNTPVSQLLSADAINSNKPILKGKNAGQVRQFAERKVGNSDSTRAQVDAEAAAAKVLADAAAARLKAQDQLNDSIDDENRKRQQAADAANKQNGLMGEALVAEQRRQAIDAAVAAAKEKQAEASEAELLAGRQALTLDEARLEAVRKTAAAEFDAAHQAELLAIRRKAQDDAVNDTLAKRQLLIEAIDLAQQQGDFARAAELTEQLRQVDTQFQTATQSAIAFWRAVAADPAQLAMLGLTKEQVDNIVIGLENASRTAANTSTQFLMTGRQINETMADGITNAFDKFSQAVANGQDAFQAARDAFLQFAADFLREIALMIARQIIFNLLSGGVPGGGGGLGGAMSGGIGSIFKFHQGGIVGQGGQPTSALPQWFLNAPRYHTGGFAGLPPGDVPAILKRNEEVLTEDDPRHAFNLGKLNLPAPLLKVINAIDAGDMVSQGLNTSAGEKAFMNFIKANSGAVKAAIG